MAGLKGLGKLAEPDAPVLRKYLEQFQYVVPLSGQMVEGVIPNGSTFVVVRHSLGRSYVGGHVVGQSEGFPACLVQLPENAQATVDTDREMVICASAATTSDVTVRVWIF